MFRGNGQRGCLIHDVAWPDLLESLWSAIQQHTAGWPNLPIAARRFRTMRCKFNRMGKTAVLLSRENILLFSEQRDLEMR